MSTFGDRFKKLRLFRNLTQEQLSEEFKKRNLLISNKENYGIPEGSSISAMLANIYMSEFDREMEGFVSKLNGMYRRYCDDIVIVIPLENDNKESFLEYFENTKSKVSNLTIQDKKTQKLFYSKSKEIKLIDEKNNKSILSYLGFDFNGEIVSIRQKSISRYYNKTYRRMKLINNLISYKLKLKCKKELYKRSSHLGAKKYSDDNRKNTIYNMVIF